MNKHIKVDELIPGKTIKHINYGTGIIDTVLESAEKKSLIINFFSNGKKVLPMEVTSKMIFYVKENNSITEELIKHFNITELYHFTDIKNIESIKQAGGLYSIERLELFGIEPIKPGGNEWSHSADKNRGLHRYIHLSFMDQHPMQYVAEKEGRIGPCKVLCVDSRVMLVEGVLFTSDISNKTGVSGLCIEKAIEDIDFQVIYTRSLWKDPTVQERYKKARRAEILIPNYIPLKYIRNL